MICLIISTESIELKLYKYKITLFPLGRLKVKLKKIKIPLNSIKHFVVDTSVARKISPLNSC